MPAKLSLAAEEQFRRVSSRATRTIATHFGQRLDMYVGCGYPKSGTVWLCQLLANYLGAPYPQNYAMPIAMRAVIHAHWRYDRRLPPTAYIHRDGRDLMVSFYFYEMQAMTLARHPRSVAQRKRRYDRVLGRGFDPRDVRRNLPRFIEAEMSQPTAMRGVTWSSHVQEWMVTPRANVVALSYEDLLRETEGTLSRVVRGLTLQEADVELVKLSVARYDFGRSGRRAGQEDRSSFMRKGVEGDWRNHFSRESAEVFDSYAGDTLRWLGYESGSEWVSTCT